MSTSIVTKPSLSTIRVPSQWLAKLAPVLVAMSLAISGSLVAAQVNAADAPASAAASISAPVNINQATASELAEVLTGVGPAKAEAIVSWRAQNGDFQSVEQLLEIKGIGEVTLAKNRSRIAL